MNQTSWKLILLPSLKSLRQIRALGQEVILSSMCKSVLYLSVSEVILQREDTEGSIMTASSSVTFSLYWKIINIWVLFFLLGFPMEATHGVDCNSSLLTSSHLNNRVFHLFKKNQDKKKKTLLLEAINHSWKNEWLYSYWRWNHTRSKVVKVSEGLEGLATALICSVKVLSLPAIVSVLVLFCSNNTLHETYPLSGFLVYNTISMKYGHNAIQISKT